METNKFIPYPVTNAMIAEAKRIRRERDKYMKEQGIGNRFDGEYRWIGDLGEVVMHMYLKALDIRYVWCKAPEKQLMFPDFLIRSTSGGVLPLEVDIKTTRRSIPPQPRDDFETGINASENENEVADWFLFLWYEEPKKTMWIVGGVSRKDFRDRSYFLKAGDMTRSGVMQAETDMHQIQLPHLEYAEELEWLRKGD